MTPERWQQIERIYHAALSLSGDSRAAFVAEACEGDAALRAEVEALVDNEPAAAAAMSALAVAVAGGMSVAGPSIIGRRVGPYAIQATLGSGGMGEVYRARDTKLERDVAIKILPHAFTSDPERLARFDREARLLASLNHPHIGAIFGAESFDGGPALVMELVEGDDLAQRLARGPIPLDEALRIARQIAEALEAAHEQGIIHRDLKPANIKVRQDGTVKVLDFGLAKVFDPTSSAPVNVMSSPTVSSHRTRAGMILGTPAYMSPEQANGAALDRRTDLFAFGAVLYEMLTGRRAFPGDAAGDISAAVIRTDPDWSKLPADTPPGIRRLLRRCLAKDRNRRLQTAGDARIEIDEAQSEPQIDAPVVGARRRSPLGWMTAAVVTLVGVVTVAWAFRATPAVPEMRLEITTPPTTDLESLAISPDGQKVVFVATPDGKPRLWVRSLDAAARPLTGTEDASFPFWSPDSRSIGFFGDGKLKRIDLTSGLVQTLTDAYGRGGAWSEDGVIVFSPGPYGSLFRIPSSGGEPVALTKLGVPRNSTQKLPHFLPGGQQYLFFTEGSENSQGIYLGSLDSAETKRLTASETAGAFLAPGWLLFIRQRTLVARRFDPVQGEVTGDPVTVAEQVAFDSRSNAGAFSVSTAGVVAYRSGGPPSQLTWLDRSGKALGTMGASDEHDLVAPALSPDGLRAVVQRVVQGNIDLWVLDAERMTRFTSSPDLERFGLWSPDGSRIVFSSNRRGVRDLYQKQASGAGSEELLLQSAEDKTPNSWSSDGRFLLYTILGPSGADLSVLPLEGEGKPFVFLSTRFDERVGQFSPDGHWVAYQSNESGQNQIYVRPFPGPGGQSQISTSGGIQVRWRPDGKELYYLAPDGKLMAVPIVLKDATLEPGVPVMLFQSQIWGGGTNTFSRQQYDVAPDGRFLMINVASDVSNAPITILLNWKPKP